MSKVSDGLVLLNPRETVHDSLQEESSTTLTHPHTSRVLVRVINIPLRVQNWLAGSNSVISNAAVLLPFFSFPDAHHRGPLNYASTAHPPESGSMAQFRHRILVTTSSIARSIVEPWYPNWQSSRPSPHDLPCGKFATSPEESYISKTAQYSQTRAQ